MEYIAENRKDYRRPARIAALTRYIYNWKQAEIMNLRNTGREKNTHNDEYKKRYYT